MIQLLRENSLDMTGTTFQLPNKIDSLKS